MECPYINQGCERIQMVQSNIQKLDYLTRHYCEAYYEKCKQYKLQQELQGQTMEGLRNSFYQIYGGNLER